MPSRVIKPASLVSEQMAQASEFSHPALRAQMERIENALDSGDLKKGAHMMSELIAQAREHFTTEEGIAVGAGLSSNVGGRLQHDSFVERARSLKARCLNAPANTDFNITLTADLVMLLSDLLENDARVEKNVDNALKNKS